MFKKKIAGSFAWYYETCEGPRGSFKFCWPHFFYNQTEERKEKMWKQYSATLWSHSFFKGWAVLLVFNLVLRILWFTHTLPALTCQNWQHCDFLTQYKLYRHIITDRHKNWKHTERTDQLLSPLVWHGNDCSVKCIPVISINKHFHLMHAEHDKANSSP